jgi:hypothetical protein
MQVMRSIGDGDNESDMLQHAVQTANNTAVYRAHNPPAREVCPVAQCEGIGHVVGLTSSTKGEWG